MPLVSAMMHHQQGSNTLTVEPGQQIPDTEPPIVQIDRNIHGFGNSRHRSSSCPASTHTQPQHPSRNSRPRQKGGTPPVPAASDFYIGSERGEEPDERDGEESERVVGPGKGVRAEGSSGRERREDIHDSWADSQRRRDGNSERVRRERERERRTRKDSR